MPRINNKLLSVAYPGFLCLRGRSSSFFSFGRVGGEGITSHFLHPSVPDRGLPWGRGTNPRDEAKTNYLAKFLPETAWKWKKLDREVWAPPSSATAHSAYRPTTEIQWNNNFIHNEDGAPSPKNAPTNSSELRVERVILINIHETRCVVDYICETSCPLPPFYYCYLLLRLIKTTTILPHVEYDTRLIHVYLPD